MPEAIEPYLSPFQPIPYSGAAPAGATTDDPLAGFDELTLRALDVGLLEPALDEFGSPLVDATGRPVLMETALAGLLTQAQRDQLLQLASAGGGGGQVDTPLDIASATGYYGGQPTLEREAWQAQNDLALRQFIAGLSSEAFQRPLQLSGITGYYGGQPTFGREQWMGDLGLAQGELTGMYGGNPTLSAQAMQQQMQQFASDLWLRQQQMAQQAAQFGSQQDFERARALGYFGGQPTLERELGIGGLTGYYGGNPTLERTLGMGQLGVNQGQLALQARAQNIDLIRNPVNFIAAQLAARGPGTTVGDLRYPGAVGGLLFGGGVQEAGPAATPGDVRIPSLQMLNQATGDELAAVGAGYQYLTGQPESLLWNQAQRLGLSSY